MRANKHITAIIILQYVTLIILITLLSSSCATAPSFKNTSYKALNMAASTYESTMETVADAYKKKMITKETKNAIVKKANIYWKVYHQSVIAYEIYIRQSNSKNKEKLSNNLEQMNNALVEFLEISQMELGNE